MSEILRKSEKNNFQNYLQDAESFIREEFNLTLNKSKLTVYSKEDWNLFCSLNNFEEKYDGLYLPRFYNAYVNEKSPFLISNIFHEFYGHGLFVEFSRQGHELLEDLIHKELEDKKILTQHTERGIFERRIENYEGFALWIENLLCQETNNQSIWNSKEKYIPNENLLLLDEIKFLEKQISRLGILGEFELPKYYDKNKIKELIKKLYHSKDIELAILYGSKKPYSDIDLFIVSNNKSGYDYRGWLDIYELNINDYLKAISNLDISVTDPLFSGEVIIGKEIAQKSKKFIKNTKITSRIINYNKREVKKLKDIYLHSNEEIIKKNSLSYMKSFEKNISFLKRNIALLTLENLKKYNY